jgi:hypothetical protein
MTIQTEPQKLINIDYIDNASRLSKQLSALLCSISGEGFETFAVMTNDTQNNLIWLADELASQLDEVIRKIALSE